MDPDSPEIAHESALVGGSPRGSALKLDCSAPYNVNRIHFARFLSEFACNIHGARYGGKQIVHRNAVFSAFSEVVDPNIERHRDSVDVVRQKYDVLDIEQWWRAPGAHG